MGILNLYTEKYEIVISRLYALICISLCLVEISSEASNRALNLVT